MNYNQQVQAVKAAADLAIIEFFKTLEPTELASYNKKILLAHNRHYMNIQINKLNILKTKLSKEKSCADFKAAMEKKINSSIDIIKKYGYKYFF